MKSVPKSGTSIGKSANIALGSHFDGMLLKLIFEYFTRKFQRVLSSKLPISLRADFNPEQDYFQNRAWATAR